MIAFGFQNTEMWRKSLEFELDVKENDQVYGNCDQIVIRSVIFTHFRDSVLRVQYDNSVLKQNTKFR